MQQDISCVCCIFRYARPSSADLCLTDYKIVVKEEQLFMLLLLLFVVVIAVADVLFWLVLFF